MAIDAIARIHFFDSQKPVIVKPIPVTKQMRAPRFGVFFQIGDSLHEGWILTDSQQINSGQTLNLSIVFLIPENVIPMLAIGTRFVIKTSTPIAEGEILELYKRSPVH